MTQVLHPTAPHPVEDRADRIVAVVAALVLGSGSLVAAVVVERYRDAAPERAAAESPFARVQAQCDSGRPGTTVADGGRTLLVHSSGSHLQCVMGALDTPVTVRAHVSGTSALDGRQEAAWPGFRASWSYHPLQGTDLTVRVDP